MPQEVSKRSGSVGNNPNIPHVQVGYDPFISWDIQVWIYVFSASHFPFDVHDTLLATCPHQRYVTDQTSETSHITCLVLWLVNLPPPNVPRPRNKVLLRAYWPLVSFKKALLNPYFWGGYLARVTSHDCLNRHALLIALREPEIWKFLCCSDEFRGDSIIFMTHTINGKIVH